MDIKNKELFKELVFTNVKRAGIIDLMNALDKTDFYTAPASTRFHDSCESGLLQHSIKVLNELVRECGDLFSLETLIVVSLFHDLCKMGFYKVSTRNTKDDQGKWIQVPYYELDDKLPYGHGEKSVFILQEYIKLTLEEAMAIRWHMGFSEPKENYGTLGKAYEEFPLALYLHIADMKATYLK